MEQGLCLLFWYVFQLVDRVHALFAIRAYQQRPPHTTDTIRLGILELTICYRGEGSHHHWWWCRWLRRRHQGWSGGHEGSCAHMKPPSPDIVLEDIECKANVKPRR